MLENGLTPALTHGHLSLDLAGLLVQKIGHPSIATQYDVEKERWNVQPQKRRWVLRL